MAGPFDEAIAKLQLLRVKRDNDVELRPTAQSKFPSKSKSQERAQHYVAKIRIDNGVSESTQSVVIKLSTLANIIEGIISKERYDAKVDMATLICRNVAAVNTRKHN